MVKSRGTGGHGIELVVSEVVGGSGPLLLSSNANRRRFLGRTPGESVVGQPASVVGQRASAMGQHASVVGHHASVVGQRASVVGQRESVVGQTGVPSLILLEFIKHRCSAEKVLECWAGKQDVLCHGSTFMNI